MEQFCDNLIDFNEELQHSNETHEEESGQQLSDTNEDLIDENSSDSKKRTNEDTNEEINEETNEVTDEDPNEEPNDDNISDNKTNINKNNKKVKKVIKDSEISKSNKRGIVYLSYIPLGLNVQKLRLLLSEFGEIDRIFLEKEKSVTDSLAKKKRDQKKSYNCRYREGWVEFKKKRMAKMVAELLNGKQIGGKRKNRFYDQIWSIKYLHKFKWSHLAEQLSYEKALRQQQLRLEIGRAKKETAFYEQMANKFNYNKRKKSEENTEQTNEKHYKQRLTDETIRKNKVNDNDIDFELLSKIFK